MAISTARVTHTRNLAGARMLAVLVFVIASQAGSAWAYFGDSFLQIPGVSGNWQGERYKGWIRVDANYWKSAKPAVFRYRKPGTPQTSTARFFAGPLAPRKGPDTLFISIDKHNPALPLLLEACASKSTIAEVGYAESAARVATDITPRPADMPEYYEYKLKDAQIAECPTVADAPEQALVINFKDIAWTNYIGDPQGRDVDLRPAAIKPLKSSGKTKAFVVTWWSAANDVTSDQCPVTNEPPGEKDYFALMSKEDAAKEHAAMAAEKTGVNYQNGQMARRGPNHMDVCKMPGVVRASANAAPQTMLARGLNLDGDDGTGAVPAGTCKHKNYIAEDGRTGIDNQLYTLEGCTRGLMGHRGFLQQYANEQRRNGQITVLVEISGIDDEKNDNDIDVTLLYSKDVMAKSASGKQILPDYTFRVTDDPNLAHYFVRLHGHIRDGIISTDPVEQLEMTIPADAGLRLYKAQIRAEIMPDGSLKGVVGGYQEWFKVLENFGFEASTEYNHGYQCPAMYAAVKEAADGLKDPVTGECNGVSSAFDIEGVPAFIAVKANATRLAEAKSGSVR